MKCKSVVFLVHGLLIILKLEMQQIKVNWKFNKIQFQVNISTVNGNTPKTFNGP